MVVESAPSIVRSSLPVSEIAKGSAPGAQLEKGKGSEPSIPIQEAGDWASVVRNNNSDLQFFDTKSAFIDGVLQIPSEIVALGMKRLKAALVAQFLGPAPPIRAIVSMANRLWGYDGEVCVSKLPDDLFLFEFPTIRLSEWVLNRSWHIHQVALILRKRQPGIQKLELAPSQIPTWIRLVGVPPQLITNEGIGWLVSSLGQPLNKFVREGLVVKVCILMDATTRCPDVINISLDGENVGIPIELPQVKLLQKGEIGAKRWVAKHSQPPTRVDVAKPATPVIKTPAGMVISPQPPSEGAAITAAASPMGEEAPAIPSMNLLEPALANESGELSPKSAACLEAITENLLELVAEDGMGNDLLAEFEEVVHHGGRLVFGSTGAEYVGGTAVEMTFMSEYTGYFEVLKIATGNLGYNSVQRVFYLTPGRSMAEGLHQIRDDEECRKMAEDGKLGVITLFFEATKYYAFVGDNEDPLSDGEIFADDSDPEAENLVVGADVGIVYLIDDSDRKSDEEFVQAMEDLGIANRRRRIRTQYDSHGIELMEGVLVMSLAVDPTMTPSIYMMTTTMWVTK
ncbi:hypothetical protein LINGRAHAP2_LOCUS27903 [Linum grandiflorum]